jgi:type IV secretory pathway VirD2 relaxase
MQIAPSAGFHRCQAMNRRGDRLDLRPGRIRHGRQGGKRPASFVGEVMRAVKKAGHTGQTFRRMAGANGVSTFGRGRRAALSLASRSCSRRVVVMSRVVRHQGAKFRSAPLARHLAYLKREGVTRDGSVADLFDAGSDTADADAFGERCGGDRHHFRFIVSPEDAIEMSDLRAFTRDLMAAAQNDLGTKLDWVAVDHWNTDNPHVHVLVRGKAEDGRDLVISRDYISRGFRARAAELVDLELGPRSELDVRKSLDRECSAERWTSLDRALRDIADEGGGVADLRPGDPKEDPGLRQVLIARAGKLERLGLADAVGPAQWILKPELEPALRELAIRGDIIKTLHRAMAAGGREPDASAFAIAGDRPAEPILGRLVDRGLYDELKGTAYVVVDGVDGRAHHIIFADLAVTGDAPIGAIVETRAYTDDAARSRLSLAIRSDLGLASQVTARGATWLDRQLLTAEPALAMSGFGADVRIAMERRIDYLAERGLARRQGQRVVFARELLTTLRTQEIEAQADSLTRETGLAHILSRDGDQVSGVYRRRLDLASGRYALIEDGSSFQLVPWRPALEQRIDRQVSGVMATGGRVDWSFGRSKGISL